MTPAAGKLEGRLVVPEGWVIDEVARERLTRRLECAPDHVSGVAAETGELVAGASYRVQAEWASLEPASRAFESAAGTARRAVLVRPGVEFEVRDGAVEVERGPLLVDPGAHVHDPWRPAGPLLPASARGRPPFPRRPVVVFAAVERDEERADWARRLVNRLVRRDVEARLAVPDAIAGLHLTRPCVPSAESIDALSPDVVVTLDDAAAEQVPAWCDGDRFTVVVALDPDAGAVPELDSWRVGQASGRRRARIGRRVDASSVVWLVHRLCAGPPPLPPSDAALAEPNGHETIAGTAPRLRRPAPERTSVVIFVSSEAASSERIRGLVDYLSASGATVAVNPTGDDVLPKATAADLMLVGTAEGSRDVEGLIAARHEAGRVTVADLGASDLVEAGATSGDPVLTPRATALAAACNLVATPSAAVRAAATGCGAQVHLLPTVLTRARAGSLRQARHLDDAPDQLVIGWYVGSAGTPVPSYLDAVGEAVVSLLAERPDARVDVVGEAAHLPQSARGNPRITMVSVEVEAGELGRWTVHLWTPSLLRGELADDLRLFVEASLAGVPSVLGVPARGAIAGHWPPDLVVPDVEEASDWGAALGSLLSDEQRRSQRSLEAARRGNALYVSAAWHAVVDRFVGWALYRTEGL